MSINDSFGALINICYFDSTGAHPILTMWCPTEPTIKEEDPFYVTSMAHALGTVNHDPSYIMPQLPVSHQRLTRTMKETEDCSPAVVKPTVHQTFSFNEPPKKTLGELNNFVHFRLASNISAGMQRLTSFPNFSGQTVIFVVRLN